jgi:uncharacterized Zn-finger protein
MKLEKVNLSMDVDLAVNECPFCKEKYALIVGLFPDKETQMYLNPEPKWHVNKFSTPYCPYCGKHIIYHQTNEVWDKHE